MSQIRLKKRRTKIGNCIVPRTPETVFLARSKIGSVFYSAKDDRYLTAIATYYSIKIKTERLYCFSIRGKTITNLVKLTIIQKQKHGKIRKPTTICRNSIQ